MALRQSYYLTWENGELVLSDTMTALSDTLTSQILAITDGLTPCIVSGGQVSIDEDNKTASVTGGYFRIDNQTINGVEIPGYFYADNTNLTGLTTGDYIVARYSASTISTYTTVITGSIIKTTSIAATDIILARFGSSINNRSNDLQMITSIIEKGDIQTINNANLDNEVTQAKSVLILEYSEGGNLILPATDTIGNYSDILVNNLSDKRVFLKDSNSNEIALLTVKSKLSLKVINNQWTIS